MNPNSIWIIKILLGVLAGVFGILAAFFSFLETAQDEKHERIQDWFRAKWKAINSSSWLTLPERATRWLLGTRVFMSRSMSQQSVRNKVDSNIGQPLLFLGVVLLFIIGCWIYWGLYAFILSTLIQIIVIFMIAVLIIWSKKANLPHQIILGKLLALVTFLITVSIYIFVSVLWLLILLRLNVFYATLIMIMIVPVYWFILTVPIESLSKWNSPYLFCLGVSAGFILTFLAFSIGHIIVPSAHIPQNFQMLFTNIIFDGLTMAVTFSILSKALAKNKLFSLPTAIFLDMLAAALFACCSLYFGLMLTDRALSVSEVLRILIAKSPDGSRFEFTPYFWVMHTTFLPTLLFLLFLLFCWIAKMFLIPVRWFFGKGQEHKSPLKLTAALCTLISVTLGFLTFMVNAAEEKIKDKGTKVTQQYWSDH